MRPVYGTFTHVRLYNWYSLLYDLSMTNTNTPRVAGSQCMYCFTERGHDYAHPHVVRAVNERIVVRNAENVK
jgi:hypothetical protein